MNDKNEDFAIKQEARYTRVDNNLDLLHKKYSWYTN